MRTIATGMLVFALAHSGAAFQTAGEQQQVLRAFRQAVADYTQRDQCLVLFPEAVDAASPAHRLFTLPVAMVFRQLIARSVAEHTAVPEGLPKLPAPLEYRMEGHNLVVRDVETDLVVDVLRDAVSPAVTVKR
jgi:hypothetical protein